MNDFVASMTFASRKQYNDCDCDDCGLKLPLSIQEAVKRARTNIASLNPSTSLSSLSSFANIIAKQTRSLIANTSSGDIFVWKVVMPPGAEPLIEYGSSDRIIFVYKLPKHANILSIGKGIFGSREEEQHRHQMHWSKGDAYFVPSNGGRAIGWINQSEVFDGNSYNENEKTVLLSPTQGNSKTEPCKAEENKIMENQDLVIFNIKKQPQPTFQYSFGKGSVQNGETRVPWENMIVSLFERANIPLLSSNNGRIDEKHDSSKASYDELSQNKEQELLSGIEPSSSSWKHSNTPNKNRHNPSSVNIERNSNQNDSLCMNKMSLDDCNLLREGLEALLMRK